MKAVWPALIALAASVLWSLVLGAIGARARRLARLPVGAWLRLPLDFLLGAWLLSFVVLLCGMLRAFRPGVLLAATLALGVLGRWRNRRWSPRVALPLLLPALLLLPIAVAPPFFYDALVYHLGLPWQALQEGRLSPHPENFFSAFPPLAQLVAAGPLGASLAASPAAPGVDRGPLAAGLERVPALLHLLSCVAAGAGLSALARRLGAPRGLALLAGGTLSILPAFAPVPGFPAAEGWADAAIVAALAVALGGRGRREQALLAGLLVGVASAARLQGIPWAAIVIALVALRSPAPLARSALATAGWIVGSAPWWLKNLALLGDPVAPLGWHPEGIETLRREAGSHLYGLSGAGDWLWGLGTTLQPHAAYLVPLALAALLALTGPKAGRARLLSGALLLSVAAWWLTGSTVRFLVPSLAVLLALAAAASGSRVRVAGAGTVLAWTAALGIVSTASWVHLIGAMPPAPDSGAESAADLVVDDPGPAFTAARALPPGSRALFVAEARGFRFPRRFVTPSPYDASPLRGPLEDLASAAAVRDWLVRHGYTHLLVNRREMARMASDYPVVPWKSPGGRRRFQELLNLTAPPVVLVGEVGIFALGVARADPGSAE